jgi:hypothetical protein
VSLEVQHEEDKPMLVLRTKYVHNDCVLTMGLPQEVLAAEAADRVSVAVILGTSRSFLLRDFVLRKFNLVDSRIETSQEVRSARHLTRSAILHTLKVH